MSEFEKNIKEALKDYQVPLDVAAWGKMEKALDKHNKKGFKGRNFLLGAFLLSIIGVASFGYWYSKFLSKK